MRSNKRNFYRLILGLMCIILGSMLCMTVSADDMDGLTGGEAQVQDAGDGGAGALGDALQSYNPVNENSLSEANSLASPILNIIGVASGLVTVVAGAWIFLQSAIDLLFIVAPVIRPCLTSGRQWVSDEAISAIGAGGQQGGQQGGMGMGGMSGGMGGMSGGMGGMSGGMGMGGMSGGMGMGMGGMGGQQNTAKPSKKLMISVYFKSRIVFTVIFFVALIVLTSSALTGVGINLAGLLFKIIAKVNTLISGFSI